MQNFESFFRDLYTDKHKTVRPVDKDYYIKTADIINKTSADIQAVLLLFANKHHENDWLHQLRRGKTL